MKKIKIISTLLACITSLLLYGQASETRPRPLDEVIRRLQEQNEIFYPVIVFSNPVNAVEEGIGPYTAFTPDMQKINQVFKANYKSIRLQIPLAGGKSVNVLLTQHKIHTDDFQLTITDHSGTHPVPMNEGRYYYGVIENGSNTLAAVSIFENEINGVIGDSKGNWNLGPQKERTNQYVYFNDHDFHLPITFSCKNIDGTASANEPPETNNSPMTLGAGSGNCAKIFFDVSNSVFNSMGTPGAVNYVNNVFNAENTIYYNDNINVAISGTHVWTIADPFSNDSTNHSLTSFQNYYNTYGFNGSIACLFDNDITAGGGLAFVSEICNTAAYSVCNINGSYTGYPNYSWDVNVVTHENGHNLGSHHTHWCGWAGGPIDNCNSCWNPLIPNDGGPCANGPSPGAAGGTIMSYCHGCSGIGVNFTNGFGPQPSAAIKARIATAACINPCTSCNTNYTATGTFSSGYNVTYWATNEILAVNATFASGSNVEYYSGSDVLLQANVEIQAGASFHAFAGCSVPSARYANPVVYNPNSTSAKTDLPFDDVAVFPNPFNGQLKVAFELADDATVSITIIDQTGRLVYNQSAGHLLTKGRQEVNINTSGLSPGMYYIRVQSGDKLAVKKVVKM